MQYLGAEFWQVKKPLDAKEKGMKGSAKHQEQH
jgi:hypothetical protein